MPACESSTLFCLNAISALSNGQGVCVNNESALAVSDGDCTCYIPVKDVEQIANSCGIANVAGIVPQNTPLFAEFGKMALATEIRKYGPITDKNNVALSKADEDILIVAAYNMGWTAEKVGYLVTRLLLTPHSHFSVVARDDLQVGICIVDQSDKISMGTVELETFYKLNIPVNVDETDLVPEKLQVMADHERIHAYADAKMWPLVKASLVEQYGPALTETTPEQFGQVFSYLLAQGLFKGGELQLSYDGLKEILPDILTSREDFESLAKIPFGPWVVGYLANPDIPGMIRLLMIEMQVYGVHAKVSEVARRTMARRADSYLRMYDVNDPNYGMIVFAFAAVCREISGEKTESAETFTEWLADIRRMAASDNSGSIIVATGEATTFLLWKQIFELAANSLDEKAVANHLGLTR